MFKGGIQFIGLSLMICGCASMPTPKHKTYTFPKEAAFFGDVKRPYQVLGLVRSKATFTSLDPNNEESKLCKNYFNKAVRDLTKLAKAQGADAVIDVKSVVFLEDGRSETYSSAECSDDGMEGQVLCQGIAVKWKPAQPGAIPSPSPEPSPSTTPDPVNLNDFKPQSEPLSSPPKAPFNPSPLEMPESELSPKFD